MSKDGLIFNTNDEIYYSMAIMMMDGSNQGDIPKKAMEYLNKALARTKTGTDIYRKITVKLADYHYGKGNHSDAIKFYREAIKFKQDKWHTKYLFNLAWSLMALEKGEEARSYMKRSFLLSKQSKKTKKYVDYSDNVMEHLPVFIDEKDMKKSLSIYEKEFSSHSKDFLIQMARSAKEIGKYKLTDYLFKVMSRNFLKKGDVKSVFEMKIAQFDFYVELSSHDQIVILSKSMAKDKRVRSLEKEQKKQIIDRIKAHITILQNMGTPKTIKQVVSHFDNLKMIDPINSGSYLFYQGEIMFSQNKYAKALGYYKKSLTKIKKSKRKKERKLLKDFLIPCFLLLKKQVSTPRKRNHGRHSSIQTTSVFIPKTNDPERFIQNFSIFTLKKKNYKKCERVLRVYMVHYPHRNKSNKVINKEEIKNQQFMLSQVFDYYIGKKNVNKASFWVERLTNKKNAFEKEYVKKASIILAHTTFGGIKHIPSLKKQNIEYAKIYNNKILSNPIRSDCAHHIGMNSLKLLKTESGTAMVETIHCFGQTQGTIGSGKMTFWRPF